MYREYIKISKKTSKRILADEGAKINMGFADDPYYRIHYYMFSWRQIKDRKLLVVSYYRDGGNRVGMSIRGIKETIQVIKNKYGGRAHITIENS